MRLTFVTGYRCRAGVWAGHRLGLRGRELGERKRRLGIATVKDARTTRWHCHV